LIGGKEGVAMSAIAGPRVQANDDYRKPAMAGYAIIALTFGIMGTWAATAPLDSAVAASGTLVKEMSRKTVQHFEGGITKEILVREGDHIETGQVLFRMDPTQPRANVDTFGNQLNALLAQEARLIAERDRAASITFPEQLLRNQKDDAVASIMSDQQGQFQDRRKSLEGQISILRSRIETLKTEIEGLDNERQSRERQVGFLSDEIDGLRGLFERGLAPKSRLLALEREKANLEGQIGRSIADRSKALNNIGESDLQIRQTNQKFDEDVSKDITEVRSKISDVREKFLVAKDVLRRLDITAPTSGVVQNLRVFTIGAVVRAGEPLLDVVPDAEDLIVQAHVAPNDVDRLRPGMNAEVRFTSFHSRTIPVISGVVTSISRDRLIDEASKQPYFLAQVQVTEEKLPPELQGRLIAGLPTEVIVPTGERTLVQYIAQPLTSALRKTFREK
jgi:HlyD family type I secretion membrane fusion protein